MAKQRGRPGQWLTVRALLCAGGLLCLALGLPALMLALPGIAHAGEWQILDWTMPGRPRDVRLIQWQGRPSILATAPTKEADGSPGTLLQVLRLGEGGVTVVASWTMPGNARWVEPIQQAPGQIGWLALRSDGWYLGQADGDKLAWQRACACTTVFGDSEEPDPLGTNFANDMGGDGTDEIVLPDPEGLTVYHWAADPGVMEPLWRYRWEDPLLRDPKRTQSWQLPKYFVLDVHGNGIHDLVLHHAEYLTAYPYPGNIAPKYAINGSARVRLEGLTLPTPLRKALLAMPDAKYADVGKLMAAIPFPTDPKPRADWLANLPAALWVLQADPVVVVPRRLPLPGAPKLHAGDYAFPLALEDLTGNGYADLLQASVRTDNTVLGLRGELRMYTGEAQDGAWTFPRPSTPITTDGVAVAELFRTGTTPTAPAALAVASTDASLGAILRSLSNGRIQLELKVHVLQGGQFNPKASQRTRIMMEGIASGSRPLLLAADVSGDGWRELLINTKPDVMAVYLGSPEGPRLAVKGLDDLQTAVPRKPQEAFVADLEGNGREALVFWFRSGKYPDRLRTVLRFIRWRG